MSQLEAIEYFVWTVEAGSFAAAARRLAVTPSTVSRKVAQLEEELGVPLLARTTRSLSLTPDGDAFHARCLRILEELTEARDALARVRKKPSGLLRIDAPLALGRVVVAPRLSDFFKRLSRHRRRADATRRARRSVRRRERRPHPHRGPPRLLAHRAPPGREPRRRLRFARLSEEARNAENSRRPHEP